MRKRKKSKANILQTLTPPDVKRRKTTDSPFYGNKTVNGNENGNENGNKNSASAKKEQVKSSSSSSSIPSILPAIPPHSFLTSSHSWLTYDKSPPAWPNGPTIRMLLSIFYHSFGFSDKVRDCVPGLLSFPYETVEAALIEQYKRSPTEVYNEKVAQLSFPTPWQVLMHVKKQRKAIIEKRYYEDNKKKINEYGKQYRADNSEQISKQSKQYRQDNSERLQEQRNEDRKQDREAYELIAHEGGLDIEAITREINAGYSLIRAKVLAAREGQISIYIMAGGSGRFCGENGGGYSKGSIQHGKYT